MSLLVDIVTALLGVFGLPAYVGVDIVPWVVSVSLYKCMYMQSMLIFTAVTH